VPRTQAGELRALLRLREAAVRLLDAEASAPEDTPDIEKLRRELGQRYDSCLRGYGPLNRFAVRRTGRADPVTGEPVLARVAPPQGGFRATRSRRWSTHSKNSTRPGNAPPSPPSSPAESSHPAHPASARTPPPTPWRSAWTPTANRASPTSPGSSAPPRTRPAANSAPWYSTIRRLGAAWIDATYVQQFLRETLDDPRLMVEHPGGQIWAIRGNAASVLASSTWGTDRYPAPQLAQAICEQRKIEVRDLIHMEERSGRRRHHREQAGRDRGLHASGHVSHRAVAAQEGDCTRYRCRLG
jgi:hypothetical protein